MIHLTDPHPRIVFGQAEDPGPPTETYCGLSLFALPEGDTVEPSDLPRQSEAIRRATDDLDAGRRDAAGAYVPVGARPCSPTVATASLAFGGRVHQGLCWACVRSRAEAKAWPEAPRRMEEAELRHLAQEILSGAAFTSGHVKDADELVSVFAVLALSGLTPVDFMAEVGAVWERVSSAVGTRDGKPTFFSARWCHKADWNRVLLLVDEERKRRGDMEVPRG